MTGSTQYKFGVLAKIVKHMKARHQEGDDHPLTLEEILDETNQLDVGSKVITDLHYMTQLNTTKHSSISKNMFVSYVVINSCESIYIIILQKNILLCLMLCCNI